MNREVTELWAEAIGAPGTVIRYGHWGQAVLVFPAEQGKAWDFENNGMVGAVADLLEAGLLDSHCKDNKYGQAWSDYPVPPRGRASGHYPYQFRSTPPVAP